MTLTLLVVALLSVGLLLSSLLATRALESYLIDRTDEQLTAGSRAFDRFPLTPPPSASVSGREVRPPTRFYLAFTTADGAERTVLSTPTDFGGAAPDVPDAAGLAAIEGTPTTVDSSNGSVNWRMLITPVTGGGWAIAAVPLTDVRATVERLALLQGVVGLVVVVLGGAVGYALVRRSVKPLANMATTSHAIADGDLTLRVSEEPASAEIDELARSFNVMVSRIAESFSTQQASEAQARESEERMRRFIADAGHELRTPLTSIRGYAELISQGAAADPADAITRIQQESMRMGSLIEDLMLLARLDEHRPIRRDEVDLVGICEAATDSLLAVEPDREVRLAADATRPAVVGDAERLRQVLDNLLSNAARYSPPTATIEVTVSDEGDTVRVSVRDRGPGLAPEERDRVFDRLYRTDEARARVSGGTGLGLAIVRSIVEAHGGTVFVESMPGDGSTFGFTLPNG